MIALRLRLIVIAFALIFVFASSMATASGFVPVRNFKRDAYCAGPQNWSMVQDSTGRVFIGNRDGMLSFDGHHWHLNHLPNYTTVRSLFFDRASGRIYAGGTEIFGYYSPDEKTGRLEFTSLLPAFPRHRPSFSEVWNIFTLDGKVWFQTDFHLLRYDPNYHRIETFAAPGRISRSALIGKRIYVALEDGQITRLADTRFVPLPGSETLKGRKIVGILPYSPRPGALLLPTSTDGLWLYDGQNASPLDSELNPFLKENQIFSACASENDYVFGTVDHGAVVKNFLTGATTYINKESGMQNNTVLSAAFDRNHNIWLCLDNGLDYAVYNSPVNLLIPSSSDVGAGYVSARYKDKVLFGTNQGLYSSSYPFGVSPRPIPLMRELKGQIWSLGQVGDWMMVSGDAGIYAGRGDGFRKIDGIGGALKVIPLDEHPDLALASTYNNFHLLQLQGGDWKDLGAVKGYEGIGGQIVRDRLGYIWLSHWRKGVYRLHLDPANLCFDDVRLYDYKDGLPDVEHNSVSVLEGRVLISTSIGVFTFDPKSGALVRDKALREVFTPGSAGILSHLPGGDIIKALPQGLEMARRQSDGRYSSEVTRIPLLADKLIPGYEYVTPLSPHELVISMQDGFLSVNPEYHGRHVEMPAPFVNTVFANGDSIVYSARPDGLRPESIRLPFRLNSLRFELASPQFHYDSGVEFSTMLEDYDDDWSPYTTESIREYTRLHEGSYTLRIRTRDPQTGKVTESSFPFRVLPPWYRSVLAKSVYLLLILASLAGLAIWVRRMMRRHEEDLRQKKQEEMESLRRKKQEEMEALERKKEQEMESLRKQAEREALVKEAEIATLKSEQLQQDVRHKSHELSSTTMNLIRKNEILQSLAEKIGRLRQDASSEMESSPALDKQLRRIQADIMENISHDDDWKSFTNNFDVVYENFNRTLEELHPNLSPSDRRLCCYLRMGLSSKEIAPLISISTKSVEMARYRLRKKLGLEGDTGLNEYLASI